MRVTLALDGIAPEELETTAKKAAENVGTTIGAALQTLPQCDDMFNLICDLGVDAIERDDIIDQMTMMAMTALVYPIIARKLRQLRALTETAGGAS